MDLDIRQIFFMMLKKSPIIIVFVILSGFLTLLYTEFFMTPLYTSSAKLYVQSSENREDYRAISTTDREVSVELVSTISELVKNDACISLVAQAASLQDVYSNNRIKSMISISALGGTENFQVSVVCPNPEHSLILANAFSKVISDSSFIDGKIIKADANDPSRGYVKKILKAGNVVLINEANKVPMNPSSPNPVKNTLGGMIVGFVLAGAALLLYEKLNIKIITEDDITTLYNDLPVLGSIPLINNGYKKEEN